MGYIGQEPGLGEAERFVFTATAEPTDGKVYEWNEATTSWDEVIQTDFTDPIFEEQTR